MFNRKPAPPKDERQLAGVLRSQQDEIDALHAQLKYKEKAKKDRQSIKAIIQLIVLVGVVWFLWGIFSSPEPTPENNKTNDNPYVNKVYTVNTVTTKEGFDDYDVKTVNLKKSPENSELVVNVPNKEKVLLVDYVEEGDYCKVEYKEQSGYCACAWLTGLPEDMTDAWDNL